MTYPYQAPAWQPADLRALIFGPEAAPVAPAPRPMPTQAQAPAPQARPAIPAQAPAWGARNRYSQFAQSLLQGMPQMRQPRPKGTIGGGYSQFAGLLPGVTERKPASDMSALYRMDVERQSRNPSPTGTSRGY